MGFLDKINLLLEEWFNPAPEQLEARRKKQMARDYRIVKDGENGLFYAQYHEWDGWQGLYKDGTTGMRADIAIDPWHYGDKTIEDAGHRINLHSTNRGRVTVWEG